MYNQKQILGTAAYIGRKIVLEEFCYSWGNMIQFCNEFMLEPNQIINWYRNNKYGQAGARNHLAQYMLGDWLFMTDSDHYFEPDLLYRMHKVMYAFDLDVLTGLYMFDSVPRLPVIYKYVNNNPETIHVTGDFMKVKAEFPIKRISVDSAGAGCLMIRSRVFDKIDKELHELPFTTIPPDGEDFSFFRRLEKLGIKSWCCPNIESHHLMIQPVSLEDSDSGLVYGTKVTPAQMGIKAEEEVSC